MKIGPWTHSFSSLTIVPLFAWKCQRKKVNGIGILLHVIQDSVKFLHASLAFSLKIKKQEKKKNLVIWCTQIGNFFFFGHLLMLTEFMLWM